MFVRKKKNKSGSTSIVIVSKLRGVYKEIQTMGIGTSDAEVATLVLQGKEWIKAHQLKSQPELDLYGEERQACEQEMLETEQFLSNIDNILVNGDELILNRVFDRIGFNQIEDIVFRKLVQSRLSYPASKAATVEYLKNYYDEDIDLSRVYRYLDKLCSRYKERVQEISVGHTMEILGGNIGVMFYDVTTLYFETDHEDELRKTGFSKEGRHKNPQIILGLLVSTDGYPLAYCIHEGNKYEGHTMLPVIAEFVERYHLEEFIVVADSGLMNNDNVVELEKLGYKYIIGAKIKTESKRIQQQILNLPKEDGAMQEITREDGRRLLVGYSEDRARKDAHNRDKGVSRLEKAYKRGSLTKESINKQGYNKFLNMQGNTSVSIDYERIRQDTAWDGLKGYLTNTSIPAKEVYAAYHNLWDVERAFRIAKSKIEVRPMFHFTPRRIEAHVCICFVALKVYKEFERILKMTKIRMSVDKVLNMAKSITTIRVYLPKNKKYVTRTMVMKRHQRIEQLFDEKFWVAH